MTPPLAVVLIAAFFLAAGAGALLGDIFIPGIINWMNKQK